MFRLDGKAALVTGGASGIGEAICTAFAKQGASVLICDHDEARGAALAERLGKSVVFARTDVTELPEVEAAVRIAVLRSGRLDIVVNCAGIGHVGTVQETEGPDWQRLFAVNVNGVFHGTRAAIDQMMRQIPRGGAIINIGSVAGMVGIGRRFGYSATKGAVIAMTRQVAIDYAKQGVRCNAICPGTIDTPFVAANLDRFHSGDREEALAALHARQPIGRMGQADEIASLAVYLAADESAFVTGSLLTIDGGLTAQ